MFKRSEWAWLGMVQGWHLGCFDGKRFVGMDLLVFFCKFQPWAPAFQVAPPSGIKGKLLNWKLRNESALCMSWKMKYTWDMVRAWLPHGQYSYTTLEFTCGYVRQLRYLGGRGHRRGHLVWPIGYLEVKRIPGQPPIAANGQFSGRRHREAASLAKRSETLRHSAAACCVLDRPVIMSWLSSESSGGQSSLVRSISLHVC